MSLDLVVEQLVSSTRGLSVKVSRSGVATRAMMAIELIHKGRHPVIICRNSEEMNELRAILHLFAEIYSHKDVEPSSASWDLGMSAFPPHPLRQHGKSGFSERIAAIYGLYRKSAHCSVVALENMLLRLFPLDVFVHHELAIEKNMEMDQELLIEQAVEWGYTRVPMVSAPGEIAARGDIIDIFCPGYTKPMRIEFFGDTIEDIRIFDQNTQRSVSNINEFILLPMDPTVPSKEMREKAAEWWERLKQQGLISEEDAASLSYALESKNLSGKKYKNYLSGTVFASGAYYEKSSFFEDWIPENAVFILPGQLDLSQLLEELANSWYSFLETQAESGFRQPRFLVLRTPSEAIKKIESYSRVYFEELRIGIEKEGEDLPERRISSFQDIFNKPADSDRPWHTLVESMRTWKNGPGQVILSFISERSRAKFLNLAEQDGIVPQLRYRQDISGLYALVSPFRRGVAIGWKDITVLGEDVIQPKSERSHRQAINAFKGMDRYDELREGDHLVHRDYGIAAFGGLKRLDLDGVENDYLLLLYSGDDRLYLPVDRLALIQQFKASGGESVYLDRLGGNKWSSSKEKARKAIEQIAQDLVEMYAYRKVAKGFSYGPINEMFREFEASFGFEETPDQARAIEEVLADMEKAEPMDRLVCGDVGFGKTEVAMRASFRAALEGRQVALLCPTTILAEQHYQTFRSRLAGFPVNVGMLSRFVTKVKQKEVLEAAAKGQVDILIGTHRLLSSDVVLPNLGLLVLDEEQRFGVRHKDKLKQMRKNVDVLTLSATPIPRTLQLSMSGVRELSVIETAPVDRKPVATALMNRDDNALKSILEREIEREGQVFWVYNRVQGLERVTEYVKKLCPSARIGMAHGQMGEKELEETMRRFWHGELDILVCTAIIESGLDFPRANTLIVDQAQMFGLGQLYQLRGRVGRSDRQAFAIFVTPNVDALPEVTRQRMRIILDMDYLGAGFQVAMEDLRLRGAGNILGESQSGHMNRLGIDLFLEMLEEEVSKMRGKPMQEIVETELNIGISANIPESYIPETTERLRYYKSLSSATDALARQEVELEMRDRFGPIPEELQNFLAILLLKQRVSSLGVRRADIFADRIKLGFSDVGSKLDPAKLVVWLGINKNKARLHPPATLEINLTGANVSEKFSTVLAELASLQQE